MRFPGKFPRCIGFGTSAVLGISVATGLMSCRPDPSESAKSPTSPAAPQTPAEGSKPFEPGEFAGAQAVLVFTGDVHGYLEPCGCAENQAGGFARRADLFEQIREDWKVPVAGFDIGGALDSDRVSYHQSKIKLEMMLRGLDEMGYSGSALGREELQLGAQELYQQHINLAAVDGFDVPFLASNVVLYGTPDIGTPVQTRVIEVGPVKVGVAAVIGKSTRQKLQDAGSLRDATELDVQDPSAVIPGMLAKLKEESPDVLVLLSQSEIDESLELAREYPEFNVVVTSGGPENPPIEPAYVDDTLIVQVGKKGKYAALVGVMPEKKLEWQVVELDKYHFANHPSMNQLMQDYQDRLKENWSTLTEHTVPDPGGVAFAGVESCKECHTFAYNVWSKSYHAHAYESLIEGREGLEDTWVSRIYDPECLACHSTGWDPQRAIRHTSGFVDLETTPGLKGQQCENCHGPGAQHVEFERALKEMGGQPSEETVAARQDLQLTLTAAKNNVCIRCHDLDNSPNFDFDTYYQKIKHSGRKD